MNYEAIAFWSQVVSAILFMGVLVWLWMRFIQPAIMTAAAAQNKVIAEAERHRDEAKSKLETLRAHVGDAESDAKAIRERLASQAQAEKARTVAEARESGERSVRNAQGELERARASARDALRKEFLDLALQRARTQAESRVTQGVNAQLIDRFVESIDHGGLN